MNARIWNTRFYRFADLKATPGNNGSPLFRSIDSILNKRRPSMSKKVLALILFVLAGIMVVLGWVIQGLPPIVTAAGFAAIGYYFYTSPS